MSGLEDSDPTKNVYAVGLQCVTVLIGAYDIITGLPVVGVIFRPFCKKSSRYCCHIYLFVITKHSQFYLDSLLLDLVQSYQYC